MNWYKKAQQVIDAPKELHYYEIGHYGETPRAEGTNYMWIWKNGDILSVKETEETPEHNTAFEKNIEKYYSGRFESKTGKLSIIKPIGLAQFREVPQSLINKLYKHFPNITQIYNF